MNLQREILRISNISRLKDSNWGNINPEFVARMNLQNRLKTGVDIAKYT